MTNNTSTAAIKSFRSKKYFFLSNFAPSPVYYNGILFSTVEHAFQAAKSLDVEDQKLCSLARTPQDAKHFGRRVKLRSDWEEVKESIMEDLLRQKFSDPELRQKLLDTGDAELIEGNTWGDMYWGVCGGEGKNRLGHLLMKIRKDIQDEESEKVTCLDGYVEKIHAEIDTKVGSKAIESLGTKNYYITKGEKGLSNIVFFAKQSDAYLWALANGDAVKVIKPINLRKKLCRRVFLTYYNYQNYYGDNLQFDNSIQTSDEIRLHMSHPACCQYVIEQGAKSQVKEIIIDHYNPMVVEEMKQFENVEKIIVEPCDCDSCDRMFDLSEFSHFSKLKRLLIHREELIDASVLSKLNALEVLDIQHTGISDISFIRNLPSLKVLDISGKHITDLSPLYELTGLETLYVDDLAKRRIDPDRLFVANKNVQVV